MNETNERIIGERNWLRGKENFILNVFNDIIKVCVPIPLPSSSSSHPKDKNLKDVMKTPTSIL